MNETGALTSVFWPDPPLRRPLRPATTEAGLPREGDTWSTLGQ